jgi:hypothetical protein
MSENVQYVPCYLLQDSTGARTIVKGDLNRFIQERGLKWKTVKNGEQRLYGGNRRIYLSELAPETMLAMQNVFQNDKYDPTKI